jgi:ribonuclease HI
VWGPDEDRVYWRTIGEEIRTKIDIRHKAIRPHLSTVPTGRYNAQVRKCTRFEPVFLEGQRQPDDYDAAPAVRLAVVYDPDGDPVGTLTLERLAILKSRYDAVTEEAPLVSRHHSAGYFEADLAALLRRYRQGAAVTGRDGRVKLENHWATPPKFFEVLKSRFKLRKERFASPLNFNPFLEEYWSVHPEDALFGAHHDAFGCRWTGSSQANAEYEHADLFKAMRWAVHSAALDPNRATFTLLIHPAWDQRSNTSYNRWLHERGDAAVVLMRIPKNKFKFCRPTQWADADAMAGHPRWDVNIVLVANIAGMEKYYGLDTRETRLELSARIAEALNLECNPSGDLRPEEVMGWWKMPEGWQPAAGDVLKQRSKEAPAGPMARPKKLVKARLDTSLHTDYTYPPYATYSELEDAYPDLPLAVDWTNLAYTDGSYIGRDEDGRQRLAGAGVYVPKQDGPYQPKGMMGQGKRMVLKSGPDGYTNTITRAELVAIYKFLEWARGTHEHLGIATDSAAAMHLISKVVREPHHFRHHKHRGLLLRIMEEIKNRTMPLKMYKVKSHSGIVGNELADIAARRGATIEGTEVVEEGAAPHLEDDHTYWLRYTPAGEDTALRPQVVGDLGKQLAKICHEELRLGGANREAWYYKAMREAEPGILLNISNKWRAAQDVPPARRRLAMAYHSGVLHCQAVAHREGRAETPHCLLCGQHDSRQHAVSGCPALSDMVTERHHGAVRMIAKEIMKGRHGTGMVMMDAGRLEKRKRDGVDLATNIPDWMFPAGTPRDERDKLKRALKPDILLYTKEGGEEKCTLIRLVEVKYCKDTDKSKQEERAESQHARLKALLADAGYEVQQHTILLGVGGTVYKETPGDLEALGVAKPRARRLTERLSSYAVEKLQAIIHVRRAKEDEVLRRTGKWKRFGPRKDHWEPTRKTRRRGKKGVG